MTVPIEIIVWLLGGLCLFVSFSVHLLIRISGKISQMSASHDVAEARRQAEMEAIKRHQARNQAETDWMRRHMGVPQAPLSRMEEHK